MSARQHMVQRAVILRNANAGQRDRNNQPKAPDWQPLPDQVPCWLWPHSGREVDGNVNTRLETLRLGVPVDAPITAADRIGAIYNRLGVAVVDHACQITVDERMGWSHRELTLEAIASAVGASA